VPGYVRIVKLLPFGTTRLEMKVAGAAAVAISTMGPVRQVSNGMPRLSRCFAIAVMQQHPVGWTRLKLRRKKDG
jgi:hypothetical protein